KAAPALSSTSRSGLFPYSQWCGDMGTVGRSSAAQTEKRTSAEEVALSRALEVQQISKRLRRLEEALTVEKGISAKLRAERRGGNGDSGPPRVTTMLPNFVWFVLYDFSSQTAAVEDQLAALHRSRACLATAVAAASSAVATTEEVWDRPSQLTSILFEVLDNAKTLAQSERDDQQSTWRDLFVDLCNILVQLAKVSDHRMVTILLSMRIPPPRPLSAVTWCFSDVPEASLILLLRDSTSLCIFGGGGGSDQETARLLAISLVSCQKHSLKTITVITAFAALYDREGANHEREIFTSQSRNHTKRKYTGAPFKSWQKTASGDWEYSQRQPSAAYSGNQCVTSILKDGSDEGLLYTTASPVVIDGVTIQRRSSAVESARSFPVFHSFSASC
ncbi:hypothetical protein FOZ62_000352, partial [Perkinsus olseni]